MIFDRKRCGFSVRALQCAAGTTADCLPRAKVEAIERAFRGLVDAQGKPLFVPWTYDSDVGSAGWTVWQTGQLTGLVDTTLASYFNTPPLSPDELDHLDHARAYDRMASVAAITDATATDFSTFRSHGGKLLLTTGWSDPIFAPDDLVRWYGTLQGDTRATGGGDAADFARLFLVPGMTHCGGGAALDDFDALGTLVDWVEKGQAPASIPASRPLCPYPAHAVLQGGKGRRAEDYVCRTS